MEEIKPAYNSIIQGLSTKSAKIRALAEAGYSRTDISNIIGVRYQHVRKVLVDAGIQAKKKAPADELTITVPLPRKERKPVSWQLLLDNGFEYIGDWQKTSKGTLTMTAKAPVAQGVYALVLDDVVIYVGLTLSGLRMRMDQYKRGHKGQRTSARVHKLIHAALDKGQQVKVLVAMPSALEWNGLPVNAAAGLEAGLIDLIRPAWNIRGNG